MRKRRKRRKGVEVFPAFRRSRHFRLFRILFLLIHYSCVNSFAYRLLSFGYLAHNAEPDVETGHCGIEKASLGGALRHHADPVTAAANDLRLTFAAECPDAFPARRPLRVNALALLVIIRIMPVRTPLPD